MNTIFFTELFNSDNVIGWTILFINLILITMKNYEQEVNVYKSELIKNLTHFENDLHCRFYRNVDINDRKEFIKEWISKNIE